MKCNIY